MILGLGLKLAYACSGLAGGVVLVAGAADGGSQEAALAGQPDTVKTLCAYATTTDPGGTTPTRSANTGKPANTRALIALRLNAKQQASAQIIVQTATSADLPKRAAVIGIATSLQESDLGLKLVGDHGTSFGLFHQKPTSGYGTRKQILNPHHAARGFFSRLLKVNNWAHLPLTGAAQTVQHSGFPGAYAKHEKRAEKIVDAVGFRAPARQSPPAKPAHTGRRSLTTDEKAAIKSQVIVAAAAQELPQDEAIAQITSSLTGPDGPPGSTGAPPAELRSLVAQQVQATAEDLCTKLTPQATNLPGKISGSGNGVIAVKAAMKMIGVPYSWGGGGPAGPSRGIGRGASTVGFDCSGLTEYAWAKAGARIGETTTPQWRAGARVPRSQLQPGDLLFFAHDPRNAATIHHVGLNIDGKRMIHAPQTGRTVEISRWAGTPYRERDFIGAVRPS